MKHVKTTNTKTNKVQYWQVLPENLTLHHTSYVLSSYSENPDFHKVRDTLKDIDTWTFHAVRFIPIDALTSDTAIHSQTQYRGHVDSDPALTDKSPFMYRGKPLPELQATIGNIVDLPVYFSPLSHHFVSMSSAAHAELTAIFADQLRAACTADLLAELKKETRQHVIAYMKQECANYRKQLDMIEAFNG